MKPRPREIQNVRSSGLGPSLGTEVSANVVWHTCAQTPPDAREIHAAMQADAMLDKGDLDGAAVWRRIVRAMRLGARSIRGNPWAWLIKFTTNAV